MRECTWGTKVPLKETTGWLIGGHSNSHFQAPARSPRQKQMPPSAGSGVAPPGEAG